MSFSVSTENQQNNKVRCKMSIPQIKSIESKSGKTFRVTLCSVSNIGRKRSYLILEELRREGKINLSTLNLEGSNERLAVASFRKYAAEREYVEKRISVLLLPI